VTTRTIRPHEEVVLLAAGTLSRRRALAARGRDLLDRVAWAALLAELSAQRLVPLLGGRILELAGSSAPAVFVDAVRAETAAAREAGALMELATLRIAAALEASGIANVPLKGPVLARALHGDPGMRFSRDIDVLVARADLWRAAAALEPLGWHLDPGAHEPVLHLALAHRSGLPDVELHWRVHWYEAEFAACALARAQPAADGVRRLRAEDELATLLLYHARDGFAGLRHPIDAATWWDAHGGDRRDALLAPIAREHPGLMRALSASAGVLDELVGVPAGGLVHVTARPACVVRWAGALANPMMRGKPQQITAEISLVDGLLTPPGQRLSFVRRRVLLDRGELPPTVARRPIGIARAEHVLRVVRRLSLAFVRPRARLQGPAARDSDR
jgi:hypothetical protein